jgi:cobaltochelatase CobT
MKVWRDDLEAAAGDALDALAEAAGDQTKFAEALRQVLRDLDLSEELGEFDQEEEQDESRRR